MEHMIQVDYSALSDAQLDALIDGTNTHLLRLLTGAQSGTIGATRAFPTARTGELQPVRPALPQEQPADASDDKIVTTQVKFLSDPLSALLAFVSTDRGDTVGDMFILGQFGQAGSGF